MAPVAAKPKSMLGVAEAFLDSVFEVSARGSTVSTEFRAGTTAFLASCNNFVVNAHIMQSAGVASDVSVVSGAFAGGMTSICSGLLSNLPLGMLPSVGPNVFIALSLVAAKVVTLDQALAISGTCGMLLTFMSVTPILAFFLGLMPLEIKYGLIVGTGLLTAFIGLKNVGLVVEDTGPTHEILALGPFNTVQVYIAGFWLIVMASMSHHAIKGSVLIGVLGATFNYWIVTGAWPETFFALRSLTLHELDFSALLSVNNWVQLAALMLMLLFSISGTVIGSARMAGLLNKDGSVPGITAVYMCSGAGTVLAAVLGTAPIFVSMSASAGIRDGGRTGLTSVFFGIYCLMTAAVFSPIVAAIPACSISPVLVLVGMSMMGEAKEIQWWNMQAALPAFLCAIFQPFTHSVANGIYVGLGTSILLFFTTGDFLHYLPGRAKHTVEEPLLVGSQPTLGKRKTMTRRRTESMTGVSSDTLAHADDEATGMAYGDSRISHMGRSARMAGTEFIANLASKLGFDHDHIAEVVEQRILAGARDVEGHWCGGVGGAEATMAAEELDHFEQHNAPRMAAQIQRTKTMAMHPKSKSHPALARFNETEDE